ncbi:hypothetical protein LEP1GSC133_0868 [Leptospira borgpetersenii serovar Pomona str. 200901868]|uniref:Uncharacterized protein n=1 Tax=Leptospira borgpetersenii serovar Pomona str. 200901868 TaxID=1192866 RepID=M6W536_LEPBO|nr:hypothetical protein LEP1GSC133_0868 [Leptospira borgpetersenii serovar Pomona str. 200901868]
MKLYLLIRIFCSFHLQWKKVNKIYPISVNLNIIFLATMARFVFLLKSI